MLFRSCQGTFQIFKFAEPHKMETFLALQKIGHCGLIVLKNRGYFCGGWYLNLCNKLLYAAFVSGLSCEASFAKFLRFWAVAEMINSSCAPHGPLSLNRPRP